MNHDEMVALIRGGVPADRGGVWVDLGAGTGNFTFALRELLHPAATIYAVDRDARAVGAIQSRLATEPEGAPILPLQADVARLPALPLLDGILMANLLHFVRDQHGLLRRLVPTLKPGGRLLLVEYEQALPVPWVPFPVPYARWEALAHEAGLGATTPVGTRRSPSSGRKMYAAVTWVTQGTQGTQGTQETGSQARARRHVRGRRT